MSTILLIIKICGVIIQKGIDLHNKGVDKELFEEGKDLVHKLHAKIDALHAKHVPEKNDKYPKPDDMVEES